MMQDIKKTGSEQLPIPETEIDRYMRRMTRRSFGWGAAGALIGLGGWGWIVTRPNDQGIPWPLRRMLELNEKIGRTMFDPSRLAPTFPLSMAGKPRANGNLGLGNDFDPQSWKLKVTSVLSEGKPHEFSIQEIRGLPHVEIVTELKCVEGWSQVVRWGGARLSDFAAKYGFIRRSDSQGESASQGKQVAYVSLQTPDGGYYVGIDLESALHPQTLLCYEMNGAELTPEHGAPLRLVTPLKYGIKHIKRIGSIDFTDVRPTDYWAERGYDWYAGH